VVEVKVREYKSNSWDTWQIQKDKYDHLMDIYNYSEGQLTPVYINFHSDGCRVFDLLDYQDIEWKEEMQPKSKFDSTLISKTVGYLTSDKGKFYPGINNITEDKLKIKQQNQRIKSEELKLSLLDRLYVSFVNYLLSKKLATLGFGLVSIFLLLSASSLVYFKAVKVKMLPFDNKNEFQILIDLQIVFLLASARDHRNK
jgi:hypothetical protein